MKAATVSRLASPERAADIDQVSTQTGHQSRRVESRARFALTPVATTKAIAAMLRRFGVLLALLLCPLLAQAHPGHGEPGTFWHEMQHQLWTFGGLIVLGALVLALGDRETEDD